MNTKLWFATLSEFEIIRQVFKQNWAWLDTAHLCRRCSNAIIQSGPESELSKMLQPWMLLWYKASEQAHGDPTSAVHILNVSGTMLVLQEIHSIFCAKTIQ
jgi:hypothetical protein